MTSRRRAAVIVGGSLVAAGLLAGRRDAFATALATPAGWVLAVAAGLQIVALLARSEAWHRASMQVLGGLINGQLGVAARIGALRRSSPAACRAESVGLQAEDAMGYQRYRLDGPTALAAAVALDPRGGIPPASR